MVWQGGPEKDNFDDCEVCKVHKKYLDHCNMTTTTALAAGMMDDDEDLVCLTQLNDVLDDDNPASVSGFGPSASLASSSRRR